MTLRSVVGVSGTSSSPELPWSVCSAKPAARKASTVRLTMRRSMAMRARRAGFSMAVRVFGYMGLSFRNAPGFGRALRFTPDLLGRCHHHRGLGGARRAASAVVPVFDRAAVDAAFDGVLYLDQGEV